MKRDERIHDFLTKNGWNLVDSSEWDSYQRDDESGVDVSDEEIVFVSDYGDWLHIPCDYYALVGAMYVHRIGFELRLSS